MIPAMPSSSIYPDRLPGLLPDFTRRIWTSDAARLVWEPRLQKIGQAWSELERESVVYGIRGAALKEVAPDHLAAVMRWAAERGVMAVVLGQVPQTVEYSSTARSLRPGEAWTYKVVYLRPATAPRWLQAWDHSDHETLGTLLGYPECCRRFFDRVWIQEQCVDTTWAMIGGEGDTREVEITTTPFQNILLRWLGPRWVPHLPCSFSCIPTLRSGEAFRWLAQKLGFHDEVQWLMKILSWPVEWTALHGIAEIKTPVVKLATRTDLTAGKYAVRVPGDQYPLEGAKGIRFPYRTGAQLRKLQREHRESQTAERNGFTSSPAMEASHAILRDVLLQARQRHPIQYIIDLGAGSGELLDRLHVDLPTIQTYGVEQDSSRITNSGKSTIVGGDFLRQPELWPGPYDAAFFMPGRLTEVSSPLASRCLQLLQRRVRTVVVYAYGDWLARYPEGLQGLVKATIPRGQVSSMRIGQGVQAGVLTFSEVME